MKRLSPIRFADKRLRLPASAPLFSLGYAAALEKVSEAVAIADPEGAVRYRNSAFQRMFAHLEDDLLGGDLLALVADNDSAVVFPVHYPDESTAGFVAVIQDTNEARQLEAQLRQTQTQTQTMDAVGRLAGGVAHDFNNLITIINGYAELALISTDMSSPLFASLLEIRKAGEQAAELAQRVLEVGRGQLLQPRVVELNALVRELIAAVRPLLGERITVATSLDPCAGCVRVDPTQIRRALLTLAMTAKESMPDGGSLLIQTARPSATTDSSAPEYVSVSLTDTGVGMDEIARTHLFEPFFRAKMRGQGDGLGLSSTFGIVKQSGGHIQVFSEPGEGATFKVYFPSCPADERADAESDVHEVATTSDLRGTETVLLVEDSANRRGLISSSLGLLGYTVLEARNRTEAESVCREHSKRIDLLIAGSLISSVTPQELVDSISRLRPAIRVVYLWEPSVGPILGRNGADGILTPFSPRYLAKKVREILNYNAHPSKPPVLVADDEAPVRALLTEILTGAGYEVRQASDGEEVLEAVRERAPGIVITDLVMPRKEGIETIAEVRRLAPEAKIIAISGAFGGRLLNVATHLGADATLAKPIAADVLLRTLDKMWSGED